MSFRTTTSALLFGIACIGTSLAGCDFLLTPTKVGDGHLYQSGEGRYDPYFASIHQEQVAAQSWPTEAKASRRPVVAALDLKPEASNAIIVAASRDKHGVASVGAAIDQTTSSETERARRLTSTAARLDDLRKHGEELLKQAVADKNNLGADKADEKKVAKKDEVKREIRAAIDAADSLASDARRGAKEASELVVRLRAAWSGKDEDERAPHAPSKPEKRDDDEKREVDKREVDKREVDKREVEKTEPAPKKPKADPPAPKKPAPPVEKRPAEEAPTKPPPKPEGEVFNP